MLENIKWIIPTTLAVVFTALSVAAFEQAHTLPFTPAQARRHVWPTTPITPDGRRTARNLYAPHQAFNKVDDVNFKSLVERSDGTVVQSFSAYRYGRSTAELAHAAQRRSDHVADTLPKQALGPLVAKNVTRGRRKHDYIYIPLQRVVVNRTLAELQTKRNVTLAHLGPPEAVTELSAEYAVEHTSERKARLDKYDYEDQVPAAASTATPSRRNGFQFPSYSLKPVSPFQPQAYREDSPTYSELPHYEPAHNQDIAPTQYEFAPVTLNSAVATGKIYREEVTKFGDINGPITALPQRPSGFFGVESDSRPVPTRLLTAQGSYNDYLGSAGDLQGSRKSRYYRFKSSRSPRVVFPSNDNIGTSVTTNDGVDTGVYFNDNVAFRDQNFGLNDLAAVQDVRNEFSLQDFDNIAEAGAHSSSTFKEKADITNELECQHRGGNCEFFLGCWMTGGLLQGTCNGLLRGCCHRTAKSANLRTSDAIGHTIDLTDLPQRNYGPVKNDASESPLDKNQTRVVGT